MNDDGILLLSTILELLVVFSIVFAILIQLISMRSRRAARLKDSRTPQSQPGDEAGDPSR